MLNLDIKAAHKLVREQRAIGNEVEWDGWDIVFYRYADHAMTSPNGVWRKDKSQWAFANRVKVNSEGAWEIDERNVRRIRRAGSRP